MAAIAGTVTSTGALSSYQTIVLLTADADRRGGEADDRLHASGRLTRATHHPARLSQISVETSSTRTGGERGDRVLAVQDVSAGTTASQKGSLRPVDSRVIPTNTASPSSDGSVGVPACGTLSKKRSWPGSAPRSLPDSSSTLAIPVASTSMRSVSFSTTIDWSRSTVRDTSFT